jgi:hypothetical protein
LRKKTLLFFILNIITPALVYAQLSVGVKVHRGFLYSHSPAINGLVKAHFNIYEATLSKQANATKYWHTQYPHGSWGVTYLTCNMGYQRVLGNVHAVVPYFNFVMINSKRYTMAFQLGTGVGYFTRPFNRTNNYKNLLIGSHIALCMRGMFESKFTINKHWQALASVGINHFSNGAFKVPNYGANILSVCAGVAYNFTCKKDTAKAINYKRLHDSLPNNTWYTTAIISAARKQVIPAGGKNYYVGILQLSMCKQLSHKYRLGLGLEYNYNQALQRELGSTNFNSLSRLMVGIHNEFLIHRLSIVSVTGVNVYNKATVDGFIMNRLGLRYYFKNNIIANVSLKTHLGQADFFDIGLGYTLYKKQHN